METRTTTSTTVVDTTCSRKRAADKKLQQSPPQRRLQQPHHLHKVPLSCQLPTAQRMRISRSALLKLRAEISVKQTDHCLMETRTTTSTTVVDTTCSRKRAVPLSCQLPTAQRTRISQSALLKLHVEISVKQTN